MVKKSKPSIVWSNHAAASFKKIYEQIKEHSYANAEKVREGIIKIIDKLPSHPEKYPPDKLKKNNPGNYRAFENTPSGLLTNTHLKKSRFYESGM